MLIKKLSNFIITMIINLFNDSKIDSSIWVFSSSFNTKFNYNSKYLFEYVLKKEPSINPLFVINDDEYRKKLEQEYGKSYFTDTKSIKGIKKVLKAGVWFTSAGLPLYGLNLNKKRLIINLWHGVPLKKIGLQGNNISYISKIYFKLIFSQNYTYILTTSKNISQIMQKSFDVPINKIKVWGQPRNDAIFLKNNRDEIINLLYEQIPLYKKIILYAPTYRDESFTKFFPFEDFNSKKLEHFLEENNYLIFIRCHQSDLQNIQFKDNNRIKYINDDKVEDIMDVINIFDLLITDYSSIYIDYLLTEKPILFLPYDKEFYFEKRGFNFVYEEVTPGPKPTTFKRFKKEIQSLLHRNQYYMKERKTINKYFNEKTINNSKEITEHVKKILKNK